MGGNLICLPHVNYGAKIYNQKVSNLVDRFGQNLPDAKFVYIDMYNPLLEVIDNPGQYGKLINTRYFFISSIGCFLLLL